LRTVGETPDYRFSLANERTFLAWVRTGLALVAGGLAVAQFLPPLPIAHLREAMAIGLLLLGGAVAVRAVDHWARTERAIRLGEELPASRFPAVLALVVGAGALLLVASVLVGAVAEW
jgi:putative membrane protein